MTADVEQKARDLPQLKQEHQCKQARPHDELICELLDSRLPKTEREHAAAREIERLRAEVDALRKALGRILENEASDWKAAEEFGGYVLADELREEARAALSKENSND